MRPPDGALPAATPLFATTSPAQQLISHGPNYPSGAARRAAAGISATAGIDEDGERRRLRAPELDPNVRPRK